MIFFEFFDSNFNCEGHADDLNFSDKVKERCKFSGIIEVQANGYELQRCCEILGRNLPPNSVYTFLGNNAQEIARNWC